MLAQLVGDHDSILIKFKICGFLGESNEFLKRPDLWSISIRAAWEYWNVLDWVDWIEL